jgi:hypothetical protein
VWLWRPWLPPVGGYRAEVIDAVTPLITMLT